MGSERRSMPEQELSIREREEELFVEPDDPHAALRPAKPFPVYLRQTPADPMSSGVKAILWVVGIAVLLLFGVASGGHSGRPGCGTVKPRPRRPPRISFRLTPTDTLFLSVDEAPVAWFAQGFGVAPAAASGAAADRPNES